MSTIIDTDVRAYLDAVRAYLDDLPPQERDDLLEDLEQHLIEVSAEGEGSLVDKLGAPQQFAAELRSSAGLSVGSDHRPSLIRRMRARLAHSWVGQVASSAPVRSVRAFLPEVRPGWWVVRGYLAVFLLWGMTGSDGDLDVVPRLTDNRFLNVNAMLAGMWLSVALGRRTTGGRMRAARIAANLVGILGLVAVLSSDASIRYAPYYDDGPGFIESLHHAEGAPITNICPYTSNGEALSNVLLFDQDGRQITNTARQDDVVIMDEEGNLVIPDVDAVGRASLPNAYPRPRAHPSTGAPAPFQCPAIAAPSPAPSPSAARTAPQRSP